MCVCDFKQDIADAAYRKKRGRPQLPGLGKAVADILFSLLLQGLFLMQVNMRTYMQYCCRALFVCEKFSEPVIECIPNSQFGHDGQMLQ